MSSADFKKAAVIGYPIAQSLSPMMHQHWMQQVGINGEYKAVEVAPENLGDFVEQAKADELSGFNITVPHKTDLIQYLDKVAPLARQMGAVNTVKIVKDGTTSGFNTDGIGLVTHLKTVVPDYPVDRKQNRSEQPNRQHNRQDHR